MSEIEYREWANEEGELEWSETFQFVDDGVSTLPGLRTYTPRGAERINKGGPGRWYPEAEARALEDVADAAIRSPQGFHDLDRAIERLHAVRHS